MVEDKSISVMREFFELFIQDGPAGFKNSDLDTGQLGGLTRYGLRCILLMDAAKEDIGKIIEFFEKEDISPWD